MWQYFSLRASQVILVVVETFLDLIIEFRDLVLSVGVLVSVKNSTFSLIEMHLMESEIIPLTMAVDMAYRISKIIEKQTSGSARKRE